jgi:hypothetical protein
MTRACPAAECRAWGPQQAILLPTKSPADRVNGEIGARVHPDCDSKGLPPTKTGRIAASVFTQPGSAAAGWSGW